MSRVIGAVLLSIFLLPTVVAVAQTAEVDWVRGTDFGQYHTFTWARGAYPIQDPDANLGMARVVQDQLERRGLKFVDPQQKFDVFVTYNAAIQPDLQNSSRKILALKVRIFDSQNNTVIWRSGGTVTLVEDMEENRRKVRGLLEDMFQKYPPS